MGLRPRLRLVQEGGCVYYWTGIRAIMEPRRGKVLETRLPREHPSFPHHTVQVAHRQEPLFCPVASVSLLIVLARLGAAPLSHSCTLYIYGNLD